jgi:hypothetical protein
VNKDVIKVAALAGIISALLPSVPTIVRYWGDTTEVGVLGRTMPYNQFLKIWLVASVAGIVVLLSQWGGK